MDNESFYHFTLKYLHFPSQSDNKRINVLCTQPGHFFGYHATLICFDVTNLDIYLADGFFSGTLVTVTNTSMSYRFTECTAETLLGVNDGHRLTFECPENKIY